MIEENYKKYYVEIISSILLLIAQGDMPYGYYTLLRIFIFGAMLYLAYKAHNFKSDTWKWSFILLAIIYNPIIIIGLSRDIWTLINLLTIFLIFWFTKTSKNELNNNQD